MPRPLSPVIPGSFSADERIVEAIKGGHFIVAIGDGFGDYRLTKAEWNELREEIFARDGRLCAYCAEPATSVDHVLARANGGLTVAANLVPACRSCNSQKGARY